MLTSIRVENFKAFEDTKQIELLPITMLSGINSAGKSSIIQALLLLKQSLETGTTQVLSPGKGTLLEQSLGDNFNDFVFGQPALEEATLNYHLGNTYTVDSNATLFNELQAMLINPESNQAHKTLSSQIDITFAWGSFGYRGRPTVRVAKLQIVVEIGMGNSRHPLVGLRLHTPSEGAYAVENIPEETHIDLKDLAFEQLQVDGLSNFLPDSLILRAERQPSHKRDVPPSFIKFFRQLFAAIRRDLSEHLYYLSAFRDPPARWYSSGQTAGMTMDTQGSNFASVLWRFREEKVRFDHPVLEVKKLPLAEMVERVLVDILHLQQRVKVLPIGKREDILEVKVQPLGSASFDVTLADVGLGYNQIMPIVVQGLLTPPGAMVIFEQPEMHLHHEVQARLVDFFVGLARAGRQVLVETHSSHIVDRICLATVKDRSNWLGENARVLFVHPPDTDNPSAKIEPVQIDSYGQILNWPPHFLPDVAALYEEILQESFAKRREEREKAT